VLHLLLDDDDAPRRTDDQVTDWRTRRARSFEMRLHVPNVESWLSRALDIGAKEVAIDLLDRWWNESARDVDALQSKASYLKDLGDHSGEALVRVELLRYVEDDASRADALRMLAEAERRAGRPAQGLVALEDATRILFAKPDWREHGLGHAIASETFELALSSNDALAARAFALAESITIETPWLPLVTLDLAARAASHVGAGARAEHYAAWRAAEKRRIDERHP
jgi:GNAT superfamily N-acetyltransferase